MASANPCAAPKRCSPRAAAERSFSTRTRAERARESSSPKGASRQPRFGALSTTPVEPSTWAATPAPTAAGAGTPAAAAAWRTARAAAPATASGERFAWASLWEAAMAPVEVSTAAARTLVPPRSMPNASPISLLGPELRLDGGHPLLDQGPDLGQPLRRPRLEAEDQERLGVGGAHQTPAVGEDHPHAVHGHRRVARGEEFLGPAHHLELPVLGAVAADLGRGEGPGDVGQQPGERALGVREELEEARRGVDAVVEAEPAVAEEDVAAHLAAEERALLLHLGLDEAVARLPHDGPAAPGGDVVVEGHGAL